MIELKITLHESHDGDVLAHIGVENTIGTGKEKTTSDAIVNFIEELDLGEVHYVGYDMSPELEEELFAEEYGDEWCDGYCPSCEYAEECEEDEPLNVVVVTGGDIKKLIELLSR